MDNNDVFTKNWEEAKNQALQKGWRIDDTGWEQHVIIDDKAGIVYRYPRNAAAAAKLADEVAVLEEVHNYIWPIQLPVMQDHTDVRTAYTYIPGVTLSPERVAELTSEQSDNIGTILGDFLAQFHRLDPEIIDHKKTRHSTTLLEYYADRIVNAESCEYQPKAKQALDKLMAGKIADEVVVHGDLHGPNIVVDPSTNSLQGVIDLSEMETGDPHLEFRKIFMTFPASLDSAIKAYRKIGGQQLDKATIIQWAYVNEWANLCYFDEQDDNVTYQRAISNLKRWKQL